jgi:hypothetical protein
MLAILDNRAIATGTPRAASRSSLARSDWTIEIVIVPAVAEAAGMCATGVASCAGCGASADPAARRARGCWLLEFFGDLLGDGFITEEFKPRQLSANPLS